MSTPVPDSARPTDDQLDTIDRLLGAVNFCGGTYGDASRLISALCPFLPESDLRVAGGLRSPRLKIVP